MWRPSEGRKIPIHFMSRHRALIDYHPLTIHHAHAEKQVEDSSGLQSLSTFSELNLNLKVSNTMLGTVRILPGKYSFLWCNTTSLLSRVKTSDSIVSQTNAQFRQGKCSSEPIKFQKNNSNHVIALAGNLS